MKNKLNENLRPLREFATRRTASASMMIVPVISMLGIVTVVAAQDGMPAFPPAKVEVALAELREMAPIAEYPGTVVSLNDSRIAAEVEGVLTWIADVGDDVAAGETIARIEPRLMQVAHRQAKANVARLDAELRYRERQLERAEGLAVSSNVSATLLDESRTQRDQALHFLEDAKAQLERAEGDLERTEIRAAFAGHVTERLSSIGEYVTIGEDVLRLVDTHRIEIALAAPIALTRFIKSGTSVSVQSGAIVRQHSVRTVVPVGDAVSRMVEIRLSAADGDWLVGAPVQVSLPRDTQINAVVVPRDALVERGGQNYIYRITDDGTAEQITADILATVGLWVAVGSGIQPGAQVIVRGAERLTSGQSVEIISKAATP
jgi:RND family efflux transporter MFP subunit